MLTSPRLSAVLGDKKFVNTKLQILAVQRSPNILRNMGAAVMTSASNGGKGQRHWHSNSTAYLYKEESKNPLGLTIQKEVRGEVKIYIHTSV